jgi:RNA-binding protein NOB1
VLQVTTVQQKKQHDPPGWGSNVSNLKEWEQLSESENKSNKAATQSKILGLKYLNLDGSEAEKASSEGASKLPADPASEVPSTAGSQTETTSLGPKGGRPRREKREPKPKPVYSIEGKKNVAVGVDASKTEAPEEDTSDWVHACSRTTRRKFLKREAKRQARAATHSETSSVATNSEATETETQPEKSFFDEAPELPPLVDEDEDEDEDAHGSEDGAPYGASVLDTESGKVPDEGEGGSGSEGDEEDTRDFEAEMAAHAAVEGEELQTDGQESTDAGVAPSSLAGSEDYLITDPSWQSSVACATGDFAMQNVILQMGLRLLSPTGVHVHELSR